MQPTPPNQDEGFLKQLQASLGASLDGVLAKLNTLSVENKKLEDSIRKANASLAGQFGRTQSSVQGLRLSLVESLPAIASMGGKVEDAFEIIKSSSEELGTNRILLGETTKDLFAAKKALSLSEFEFSRAIGSFHNAGIDVGLMRDRMQETLNIARLVGVNSNAVFQNVQANLNKLNEFGFKDGVDGLSRMAAKAVSMRFDMSQIFNFAEKVFSPEGAIEAVATFQRLGVAVGDLADPFRLMYLASEDVEGLTDQVVKMTSKFSYFDEKTKEFKIFPYAKRDMRDLATAMGTTFEEVQKISFAQTKLNKLSSEFKFNANVEETDKQLIANLAQYSKEKGGFVVKVNREEKLVTELNKEDIEKLRGNPETVEDVARAQLSETELIQAAVNGIFDLLRGISVGSKPSQDLTQLVRASTEAANKAAFKGTGGVRGGIRKIDEKYAQIPGVIKELTDDLKNNRLDFKKYTEKILGITEKYAGDLEGLAQKIISFDFKTLMKESPLIEKDNLFANALGLSVTATNKLITWLETNVYKPVVNNIPNQASSQSTSSGNQKNPSSQAYASTNVDTRPTNFTMTSVNTNLSELGNQVDNTKNKFTDLTTNTSLASVAMTSTNTNLSDLGNQVDNTKNKFTDLKSVIKNIIEANNTTPTNVPVTSVNTNLSDLGNQVYNTKNKFFDFVENNNKQQLGDTPNTIPTNDAMTSVTTNLSNLGNQVDNTKNKFTDLKSVIENIIEANNTTLTSVAMTSNINVLPEIAQLTSIISQFRDINLLTAEKNEIKPLINNDQKIEVATIEPPSSKQLPIQQQNPTMSFSPLNGKIDVRVTREDGGPSVDLTSQVVASAVFQREVLRLIDGKIQQPNYSNVPNSATPV